ncbi:MAG: sugar phosphate isomerase/epimerase [Clostridia bacterium]|nr:sugar phosphate isomerase/epimerase [Clostridia bacterium]
MDNRFIMSAFSDEAGDALSEQIAALKRNNLAGMEIRGIDGANIVNLTPEKVREVKTALDAEGLRVYSIGSPAGKIGVTDDFAPHLDSFKRMLDSAHILGAERMRIFSFYVNEGELDTYRDEVMERLSRFCDAAKGSGVTLCHENEKGIYGECAERCVDIAKTLPAIRLIYDPANLVCAGLDAKASWDLMAPYVEYLHIKDAFPDGRIVPAGEGEGAIPYVLAEYAKAGGRHLTLEPHLAIFGGLKNLEKDDSEIKIGGGYATQNEAFDAAVTALNKVIGEIKL